MQLSLKYIVILVVYISFAEWRSTRAQETLVVVADRRPLLAETRVPVDRIDREDIELRGGRHLVDILATIPGLQVKPGIRGFSVMLQGLDSRYVLILVNGQRTSGSINGEIDLSRFPVQQIESIEVIRGPSAALHGSDAIGGVINIITKRNTLHQSEIDLRYGSFQHRSLYAGTQWVKDNADLRLDLGHSQRDSYSLTDHPLRTDGPALQENFLNVSGSYWPHQDWELASSLGYTTQEITRIDAKDTGAVFDQSNDVSVLDALFKAAWQAKDHRSLQWTINHTEYRDQYTSDQRFSDVLDSANRSIDQISGMSMHWYESQANHDLAMGVDFNHLTLETDRLLQDRVQRDRLGLFVQDQWRFHSDWVLVPGIRWDQDSAFSAVLSKKLALRWQQRSDIDWHAAYSEGYRAPDFKELFLDFHNPSAAYQVKGNENLEAEYSTHRHVQMNWQVDSKTRLSLNVFRNDVRNLIAVQSLDAGSESSSVVYSYANIAAASLSGLESSIEKQWTSWLQNALSFEYLEARNQTKRRQLENRPQHAAKFQTGIFLLDPEFSLNIVGNYSGKRPFYVNDEVQWLQAFVTWQMHANMRFSNKISLYSGVTNLTNAGDSQYLPLEPRNIYAGAKYTF